MIPNKPYAWLYDDAAQPEIHLTGVTPAGEFIQAAYLHEVDEPDRLILTFQITGSTTTFTPIIHRVRSFDPAIHRRIVVLLADAGGLLTGLTVLSPNTHLYSPEPPALYDTMDMRPYQWLKVYSASSLKLHTSILLPPGFSFSRAVPSPDPSSYQCIVKVVVVPTPGASGGIADFIVTLDDTIGYDPVCENIITEVILDDGSGTVVRKGKGTTISSEGDASSDI